MIGPSLLCQNPLTMYTKSVPSLYEKITLPLLLLQLPLVLLFNALFARNSPRNRHKLKPRVLFDSSARFILQNTTPAQLQAISVPSYDAYLKWAQSTNEAPIVDDLTPRGRLLWLGPRRGTRAVIYCHGGGFVGPLCDFECHYWTYFQKELATNLSGNNRLDVAMLEYSVWPNRFPTQLQQLISAIQCVLSTGVQPSNLYLAGDSSGANLIMQLISHILQPLKDVPPLPFTLDGTSKLGGIILYSPFVAMTGKTGSHLINNAFDLVPASCLESWGKSYLDPIPEDQRFYAHVNVAPEGFFEKIDKIVRRIMITAGEKECLRDDIILFSDTLKKFHRDVTLILEKDAVHANSIFAFAATSPVFSSTSRQILEWMAT